MSSCVRSTAAAAPHDVEEGPRSRRRHAGVRVGIHGDVAPGRGHAVPGSVGRGAAPLHDGDAGFCRRIRRAGQLRDCRGHEHHARSQVRLLHGMSRADQLPREWSLETATRAIGCKISGGLYRNVDKHV